MEVATYTSRAHREGTWWIVQCEEVPGANSEMKQLNEAAEAQREAIAYVSEIPVKSIEVRVMAAITPRGRSRDRRYARNLLPTHQNTAGEIFS